jgi:DNA-binding beta-propeller fold protein YncE
VTLRQRLGSWLLVAVAALGVNALPPSAVASVPPTLLLVASLGGPGHADLYASGLEVFQQSLIVADTGNNRIKKFALSGALQWEVGSFGNQVGGFSNPRDVGVDRAGTIYVADTANRRIVKLAADGTWLGSWKGPASDPIVSPMGVTVSNDLVYVADAGRQVVRVFNTSGTEIRVIGSDGACQMAPLRDVDADRAGNVYVANYTANTVLKFSSTGSCLAVWGAKGSQPAQFKNPYGVRVARDPVTGSQMVYIADSNNGRIQEFSRGGQHTASIGSLGTYPEPGTFASLRRVAVSADGDVWGADLWQGRLERFDRSTQGYSYAETIGTGPAPLQEDHVFNEVRGIDLAADGTIWATDSVNQRLVHMGADGRILGACGARGWGIGEFNWPRDVAVDPATGNLWVADTKQSRLQVLRPDCGGVAILSSSGSGRSNVDWPDAVAIRASDGVAVVADTNNDRLSVWNVATRAPVFTFDGGPHGSFNAPRGVWLDPSTGHVWVADSLNDRIVELSMAPGGTQLTWLRAIPCGCLRPSAVATDRAGHIFVADTGRDRVVELSDQGALIQAITGLNAPAGVTVGSDGSLFVSNTYNDRILVYRV